jgi:Ser/Thr protein kinase RdoA (MazF antagonist)
MHDASGSLRSVYSAPGNGGLPAGVPRGGLPHPRVIYSTFSIDAIEEHILCEYELVGPYECVFFNRGVSDTYQLSAGSQKFALKVYRSHWRCPEQILSELAAIEFLAQQGIAVARAVPRRDGRLITEIMAPEGPRSAVLFNWVDGFTPRYSNPAHARCYGELLARLHTASDSVIPDGLRPRMDLDYLFNIPVERLRIQLSRFQSISDPLGALVERTGARLLGVDFQRLDWGFCHGDIWAGNARIQAERLVLFDFDFCGSGWRVADLASYKWEARCQGSDAIAWPAFSAGYLQWRPQAVDELKHIGIFIILRHLWTTAHWLEMCKEQGATLLPEGFLDEVVPFCERVESELG